MLTWFGDDFATTSEKGAFPTSAEYTFNPCSPAISVPTQLFAINSDWATCLAGVNALCDPPFTLTPAAGLEAFATTTSEETLPTPAAVIAPSTPTPTPSPTLTAAPSPTASPQDSEPTVNNDPPAESEMVTDTPKQSTTTSDTAAESPANDDPAQQSPASNNPPSESPQPNDPSPQPATTTDQPTVYNPASIDSPQPTPTNDPSDQVSASEDSPALSATSIIEPMLQLPSTNDPSGASDPSNPPVPQETKALPTVITVDSSTLTANSESAFVYDAQKLSPGGAMTVSGVLYSIPTPMATSVAQALPALVTIGSSTLTANSASLFVYGSQTLAPGASITVSGSVYSVPTAAPLYTVGPSAIIVGSQTLVPGAPAITISSHLVSLASAGSVIIDNSVTEALSSFIPATETKSCTGLGGAIMSVGGFASSTDTPNPINNSTGSFNGNSRYGMW